MAKVNVARANTTTVTPVTAEELLDDYGRDETVRRTASLARQNGAMVNWSTYRQRLWDPNTNTYINGQFTTDVWLQSRVLPGSSGTVADGFYEWPFTIVARVRGAGVDQILRRQTTMIPEGYRDF
jgi:hypothetical protein